MSARDWLTILCLLRTWFMPNRGLTLRGYYSMFCSMIISWSAFETLSLLNFAIPLLLLLLGGYCTFYSLSFSSFSCEKLKLCFIMACSYYSYDNLGLLSIFKTISEKLSYTVSSICSSLASLSTIFWISWSMQSFSSNTLISPDAR